jgi:hypothetical protein
MAGGRSDHRFSVRVSVVGGLAEKEYGVKGFGRAAAVMALVVVLSAPAAGAAWGATGRPVIGRVTKVSVTGRYFVVNGKVIHVRRTTVIHVVKGPRGLAAVKPGRRVRVVVVGRPGRLFAVEVRLLRALARAHSRATPTFTG